MTFEYGKLLLLKSPQNNKVASNIEITEKSQKYCMPGPFWDKSIDFTNEPVVQCDPPAIKSISLDDDDDDDDDDNDDNK